MDKRKMQLIAGSTYSISLPKTWVKANKLKEKDILIIDEKNDKTLTVSPDKDLTEKITDFSINVDEYLENIEQILFTVYYLDIESITLVSKTEIKKETRSRIRKVLTKMSGTQINYEDKKKITIDIILEKRKINIFQILYRMYLLIEMSLVSLEEDKSLEDIKINEDEINRLHHLIGRISTIALSNYETLQTSQIKSVSLVPSILLISKKLEKISDVIIDFAKYLEKTKKYSFQNKKQIFKLLLSDIRECMSGVNHINKVFNTKDGNTEELFVLLDKVTDKETFFYLRRLTKFSEDIKKALIMLNYNRKLISQNKL